MSNVLLAENNSDVSKKTIGFEMCTPFEGQMLICDRMEYISGSLYFLKMCHYCSQQGVCVPALTNYMPRIFS